MNCAKWIWLTILIVDVVMATDLSLATIKLGDTLSLLNEYEIFIPTMVDTNGQFLSYDVRHKALKKFLPVKGRSASSFSHKPILYSLKMENKHYILNLTENNLLLGHKCILEVWHSNHVEKRNLTSHRCHYYGHVVGESDSQVTISNCFGLHGIFSISGEEYVVEPYWNHTNVVHTQGHPHILYKRSSLDFKRKFKGNSEECSSEKRGKIKKTRRRRRKRSIITERYVETLVVADKKTVAYHGEEEIETYILTIMNIVAKLFRDPSLGNAVNVIVTRIILLKEKQPNLQISHHAGQTLSSFCKWQETIKQNENSILSYADNHHDNAILITRYDICFDKDEPCDTLGLAQVAGMCERGRSCSINQDIGLTSGFTIAHELGHNFGMQHDGSGNDCYVKISEPGYIMSTQLSRLVYPVKWSRCSRQYITDFFDSGQGDCLQNVPPMNDYAFADLLPGQRYNADQQCRSQFGPHSFVCEDIQGEVCGTLWCSKHKGRCIANNTPLLDGTICNTSQVPNGWCYGGECVTYGTIPSKVDGSWGEWSEWGICSRKCGGGIETSERQCDKPKPSHGGKFCVGKRKRYRSCNVKECPSNSEDFRAMQCRKFNNIRFRGKYYQWIPFTADQVNSCSLYCQAVGYNFYVEQAIKVIDGTRCNEDSLDVCINGRCMPVGCDGILNSKVTEDRCRKCGGDGSSCRTRRGLLESRLENKVNTYVEVVRIPKGASHILITEKKHSNNYLALKTSDGEFPINGKWTISWPAVYNVAGTRFHYQRMDNHPESLRAIGPISEEITIMVLLQEPNKGIRYEFNEPMKYQKTVPNYTFKWVYLPWSECSKSCGKGITRSEGVCVRKDDQSRVSDIYCVRLRKPAVKTRQCNLKPCPPRWNMGTWGKCTRSCGGGYKTRDVFCVQKVDNQEERTVDEVLCLNKRPIDRTRCNEKPCPTRWHTGKWSKCIGKCGIGYRNRTVTCVTSDGMRKLPYSSCLAKHKPPEIEPCNNEVCPKYHWVTGRWTECNTKCGKGQQTRQVQCKSWKGENSHSCMIQQRPSSVKECHVPCTTVNEVCTDVNKIGYCSLVLKFKFCSRAYFRKMCCKTCTK